MEVLNTSLVYKLSTLVNKIYSLPNKQNVSIIMDFHNYMQENGSSENHKVNTLKVVMEYAKYLGSDCCLLDIDKPRQIISFLNTKIKDVSIDPDKRWITTWNHYLNRMKLFFRWMYNVYKLSYKNDNHDDYYANYGTSEDWVTPDFIKIKQKKTNRISPYIETELWERDEILTIIKYEKFVRNKAIISLMWDLDARPHEITLLKIKHIRLKSNYGEGEIPHQAKTGAGPILLTYSFPYVRDWLNAHPFKNESDARLICNLHTGAPLNPKTLWGMMQQLRKRIIRLLENGEIKDSSEKEKLEYLVKTKKWNPYCFRHSAITSDSDYLPEYALKKKVRWTLNSRQGNRYIKNRMGSELKNKILEHSDISIEQIKKQKPSISTCPRCEYINPTENMYCSKCSYPLSPEAFDMIKQGEESRYKHLEKKFKDNENKLANIENTLEKLLHKVDMKKLN
jgi:integrase/recombinase XerD